MSTPEPRVESAAAPKAADIEARVRWVREVLAGRAPAQPLVPNPKVEALLEKVGRAKYRRETIDWLYLQDYYGGQPVLTFVTPEPDSYLTVLAAGDEVADVLPRLTPEEQSKVVCECPPQPLFASEVGGSGSENGLGRN